MPKRGEHIHKRKDGRWEGRYKRGINKDGKTVYKSVYAKSYGGVKEKLRDLAGSKIKYTSRDGEKTFRDVLLMWREINRPHHKGATDMKYTNLIEKHILPELGEMKLSQFDTFFLSGFMNRKLASGRLDKKGGLSPSYVRSIMLIITSSLNFAISEHMCPPMNTKLCKPPIRRKSLRILDADTQKKLETTLLQDLDETKLGILLSLQTGLRISEVCALKWEDIDLDKAVIHVRATIARVRNTASDSSKTVLIIDSPKTSTSLRDIPISSTLMPVLLSMQNSSKSPYVISATDKFVSPRTYEYKFHKILQEENIPEINYHALRHTFATRCVEAGIDIKTLSEILGHADAAITLNTYVHSSLARKREQIEKLNRAVT